MKLWSKSAIASALLVSLINPTSAVANSAPQNPSKVENKTITMIQAQASDSKTGIVKVLPDHPGAATALTPKQKSEIKKILVMGKGNQNFQCTGTSLAGQRESMYRVVLLRAQLVCEYAKSLDPSIEIIVKERVITLRKLNGRVEVASN